MCGHGRVVGSGRNQCASEKPQRERYLRRNVQQCADAVAIWVRPSRLDVVRRVDSLPAMNLVETRSFGDGSAVLTYEVC
jgi:hypothetical protein